MTTEINIEIASSLITEIEEMGGVKAYAEFMDLESHLSTDLGDLSIEEIKEAAQISKEQAECLDLACSLATESNLWESYRILIDAVSVSEN